VRHRFLCSPLEPVHRGPVAHAALGNRAAGDMSISCRLPRIAVFATTATGAAVCGQ
jgi:hypothetical protein